MLRNRIKKTTPTTLWFFTITKNKHHIWSNNKERKASHQDDKWDLINSYIWCGTIDQEAEISFSWESARVLHREKSWTKSVNGQTESNQPIGAILCFSTWHHLSTCKWKIYWSYFPVLFATEILKQFKLSYQFFFENRLIFYNWWFSIKSNPVVPITSTATAENYAMDHLYFLTFILL